MSDFAYLTLTNYVVVFDTETGGLEPEDTIEWDAFTERKVGTQITGTLTKLAPPILELGAVVLDPRTLKEIDQFHSYCGAEAGEDFDEFWSRCDRKALETNNFKDRQDLFRTAPPLSTVLRNFVKWAPSKKNEIDFLPAGQNVRYDIDMINMAFRRYGIEQQIWSQPLELITFANLYFALPDTEIVANYRLETICKALKIPTEGAHTALADVRMTSESLRRMFKRLSR